MITLLTTAFLAAGLAPAFQESSGTGIGAVPVSAPPPSAGSPDVSSTGSPAGPSAKPSDAVEATAEGLRSRIRDMRMNLLLGGDQVRRAEKEAVDFYSRKTRSVEGRIDDVATELVELRAKYDVVLDRALASRGTAEGAEALREAQPLRAQIVVMEGEADALNGKRNRLSELVASVEERDRDRQRLVDQLESSSIAPDDFGAPMMSIGLAPKVDMPSDGPSPAEDDALIRDLMARDPRGTKALLWEEDPAGYWDRFPLQPPAAPLRKALLFPRPDPVGRR